MDTIKKLDYSFLKIKCVGVLTNEFNKLLTELGDFDFMIEEELEWIRHYQTQDIICLCYSEDEENLKLFYELLLLLIPSKIDQYITFDSYYSENVINGKKENMHRSNGISIWKSMHVLFENSTNDDHFYLNSKDILFVNKLIKKYKNLRKNPSYLKFISFYKRAYHEEKDYFKYLLLFMIIESLIINDETTGVVFKIRRICAILVGNNYEKCQMIFDKTRDAYNIRSKFVHSGKNEVNDAKYLPYLHSLVCEIGIMILISKLNSDELFKITNSLGFGQRKTLIHEKSLSKHLALSRNERNFHLLDKKKK